MKFLRIIAIALMISAASFSPADAAPTWESVEQAVGGDTSDTDAPEVAVTRDGWVYITLRSQAQVKVLSILGQVISQETLKAGTFRLHISSKGIYILKIGDITRRISI